MPNNLMDIALSDIFFIKNTNEYKIHMACWNGKTQPLDVFIENQKEWKRWNMWRGQNDDFNRKYIFSLINFHYEGQEIWLFGGVYKVLSRGARKSHSYKIQLVSGSKKFIGRLKIRLERPGRARALLLENFYKKMIVSEILKESYSGEIFCGYENINYDFSRLEIIYRNNKQDWKAALENIKGVYLITDKSNGKRYIGAAYGDFGIWSRWGCYIDTGHGWNDELLKLIKQKGKKYARNNFRFTLLEYRSMKTDDKIIIEREKYWKEVLPSRGRYGYNKN